MTNRRITDIDQKIKIGFQLHQAGRLTEAGKVYLAVLRAEPENHQANNLLGLVALQSDNTHKAIALIAKAVALAPENAGYHSNLGEAYRKDGQHEKAIAAFQSALRLEPGLAGVDAKLGKVLLEQDDGLKAIAVLRRAIKADPDSADTWNNLAAAYVSQRLMDEAINCWMEALQIEPTHHQVRSNLGVALRELGRLDEAIAHYEMSLSINPDLPEAHCNLGIALREKGEMAKAIQSFDRAIELKPNYVDALYMHALSHDFVAGDDQFMRLQAATTSQGLNNYQRILLNFGHGKACDQVADYETAFASYARGNEGMSAIAHYDMTTHRAEISSVIEACPEALSIPGESSTKAGEPIFVLGISRSGKTLVESVLARHDDVYPAMEHAGWSKAMNEHLFAKKVGRVFPDCLADMDAGDIDAIGEAYRAETSALSPGMRYIVNTSPGNYLYVGLILQAFPSARIIYCRREVNDNALFVYFSRYRQRHEYAYQLRNIATYFQDYDRLMAHWRTLYGDRLLEVNFESLVGSPEQEAQRLFDFCDLAGTPSISDLKISDREVGHWKNYARHFEDWPNAD